MSRRRATPPPLHDPCERILVESLGEWQIRIFRPSGDFHRYFAAKGILHVQLWHPEARVSLLTPSPLTAGRYEVYPFAGWKHARHSYQMLAEEVRAGCGLELPREDRVLALVAMFGRPHRGDSMAAK